MKKLLSLLLALTMLLGCVAFGEGVDYTGAWVLTGAEGEGIQMGPSTMAAFGMEMKMTINADGTALLVVAELEEMGSWVETEAGVAITDASNETMNAVYQDEMLVVEEDGMKLMFTREGAEPAIAEAAGLAARSGVPAEEFEGQWLLTKMTLMGMELAAEDLGMYMAFVLSGGVGILGSNDTEDGSIATEDVVYTVAEVEGVGTVLSILPAAAEAAEEEAVNLLMAEDGTLFVEEEGASMIFEKQVEEAAAE